MNNRLIFCLLAALLVADGSTLAQPVITQQPTNQTVLAGGNASFAISVSGAGPFKYQWYFSNSNLQVTAGGVALTYLTPPWGFVYGVIVTNGGAGYTTIPQVHFIGGGGSGAAATNAVSNGYVTETTVTNTGSGYTNSPAVVFDPPNGLLIGQTNANLPLNTITTNNVGSYYVVITNSSGSVTSSVASLTITLPPGYNQLTGQYLGGDKMRFSFVGNAGGNYALDRSFSLSPPNWIPQGTNPVGAGGALVLTNTPDPSTNNFWRIRSVP